MSDISKGGVRGLTFSRPDFILSDVSLIKNINFFIQKYDPFATKDGTAKDVNL